MNEKEKEAASRGQHPANPTARSRSDHPLLLSLEIRKYRDHGYLYDSSRMQFDRWEPNPQHVFFLVAVETLTALGVARPSDKLSKLLDEFIDKLFKAYGGKDNG